MKIYNKCENNAQLRQCNVKLTGKIGKSIMASTKDDKLYFFSKSAQVPAGQGKNETVKDSSLYQSLGTDFRQVLSNFHIAPFKFEDHTYNTIEHVFQAKKIALVDEEKAYKFTIESGDKIGLGDGAAAQKNRKLVVLDKAILKQWDEIKDDIMMRAALAKYQQNPEAAQVLKATLNAQLWHIQMRKPAVRFVHLETIRDALYT